MIFCVLLTLRTQFLSLYFPKFKVTSSTRYLYLFKVQHKYILCSQCVKYSNVPCNFMSNKTKNNFLKNYFRKKYSWDFIIIIKIECCFDRNNKRNVCFSEKNLRFNLLKSFHCKGHLKQLWEINQMSLPQTMRNKEKTIEKSRRWKTKKFLFLSEAFLKILMFCTRMY